MSIFCLPVRLTSTDFVASPSASQSWTPPSSLSSRFSQTTQSNDNGHGDARSSYRPSRLSYQPSVDAKDSTKPAKVQSKTGFGKDSKRSAVQIDSAQFHFSIYKWANKGVPLSMLVGRKSPSRSKENVKIDRSLSATVSDFLVGGNLKVAVIDEQSQSVKSSNSTITYSKSADSHSFDEIAQELSKSVSNSSSLLSTEKPVIEDINVHGFETPRELKGSSEKGSLQKESKASNPKPSENMRKFNTKTLGSFLQNEKKDDIVMAENGEKDRKIKDKEKPSLEDFVPSCKVNKVKAESFRGAKDDFQKGEAAGAKVKDFVKLFNQERSSKATKNIQGRSQSSRWRETNSTFEAGNDKSTAKTHEDGPVSSVNWETTPAEDSEMADGDSFLSGKPQVDICNSGRVSSAPNPVLPNEPTTKGVRDFTSTTNATRKDDLPTKNSMQEVNLQAEVEKNDEMKSYEDKVRKWSKGKEGNIRALLSTLPYVLWPNSGWKPVPLVDIIEGNAVKRSYQRALLCLHPDKLQQKGAEPHQKFVAEKVFDVLQEAWDHFNSLGTL